MKKICLIAAAGSGKYCTNTRLAKAIATLEWATESCSVMRWR